MSEEELKTRLEIKELDVRCDFCGSVIPADSGALNSERKKYCSKTCQSRASRGRIKARLARPTSKRYAARLKFSDPLYFS